MVHFSGVRGEGSAVLFPGSSALSLPPLASVPTRQLCGDVCLTRSSGERRETRQERRELSFLDSFAGGYAV